MGKEVRFLEVSHTIISLSTMFSLSPSIVSALEWHLEEQMIHEIPCDDLFASYNNNETDTSPNSGSCSPQLPDFEHEDINNSSTAIKTPQSSMKKSGHNEYERDRRIKLNKLYSSLRELLPEKDQRRKLSIPCTVARVLKYIPELQRHVERLIRKREELQLRASRDEFASTCSNGVINPVISATCLSKREIMIQICILSSSAAIPFSKVARILEGQGLQLINATTHTTNAERTFYALHLQAKEAIRMDGEIFCEQLMNSLSEQRFQMPECQNILQQ